MVDRIDSEIPARMREKYTKGTRVMLYKMNDPQSPPIGTFGTVKWVDDTGGIGINWDNGSSLKAIYAVDVVRKVYLTTICYGEKKEWTNPKEAERFFLDCIANCDPNSSECSRYVKVYTDIISGKDLCTDE